MALEDVQKVLAELKTESEARDQFLRNREAYLLKFKLNETEREAFFKMSLDSFLDTQEFLDKFSDEEVIIISIR